NAIDLMLFLFAGAFAVLLETHRADSIYVYVGVCATVMLMLKSLSFLRGFESTGWLITVLMQNIEDVKPFLVVITVIILGSSVAFRLLLGKIPNPEFCSVMLGTDDEPAEGATWDTTHTWDCDDHPYGGVWSSFMSVFLMSVLGDFDTGLFEESPNKVVSQFMFLFVSIFVTVIALNAIIALLGDSYSKVSEQENANKNKERAELICEYLGVMRGRERRSVAKYTK
ncbi:hypothetical protein TeGR_g15080, partial [Tetraparma gracilis]